MYNNLPISTESLKYLVMTSCLLQSCIDKSYIQKAVQLLDDDIISTLELDIAEEILNRYYKIRKIVKK